MASSAAHPRRNSSRWHRFAPPPAHGRNRTRYWAAATAILLVTAVAGPGSPAGAAAPPHATPDFYTTAVNTPLTVAAPGVLQNDTDPDGDVLTARLITRPSQGRISLNPDGSFTFAPPRGGFYGLVRFTYAASDGTSSSTAEVRIFINRAPVATPDAWATLRNSTLTVPYPGVLGNDYDDDQYGYGGAPYDFLTVELVRGPFRGSVDLAEDGSFAYTPRRWFAGPDSFEYRVSDGYLWSAPTTVSIKVKATNRAPVAQEDSYTGVEDTKIEIPAPGFLANDTDVDGDTLHAEIIQYPTNGVADFHLGPDGTISITPLRDYNGPISFQYVATDGIDTSKPTWVTFELSAVNDPPDIQNDLYYVEEGGVLTVDVPGVLYNDTDPEGDKLATKVFAKPAEGRVVMEEFGSFVYYAPEQSSGTDYWTYEATDGEFSGYGQVQIVVLPR